MEGTGTGEAAHTHTHTPPRTVLLYHYVKPCPLAKIIICVLPDANCHETFFSLHLSFFPANRQGLVLSILSSLVSAAALPQLYRSFSLWLSPPPHACESEGAAAG